MKHRIATGLVAVAGALALSAPGQLRAQTCPDEQAMFEDSRKTITDLVDMVKKESLGDFQAKFHQKSCISKLNFALSMLDETVKCFDKAAQDAATPKDQAEAAKAKKDAYAKLQEKLNQYVTQLKSTDDAKTAKAIIEKFDLAD